MKRISLSTTQIIMLSFVLVILIGSLLLSLPISTQSREPIAYVDALFTATTATCVTGLVTLPTVSTWSIFGQVVILIMIQIGGLGLITVISGIMISLNKKIGLGESRLIGDAFNLNSLSELSDFVRKVIKGTVIIEVIGALLYMPTFIRDFGARGIWISVFNSVSAFCNAGIDIISESSLTDYATSFSVNAVTCLLVVLGGLGYLVWWDVLRVLREFKARRMKCFKALTLHSKIVLSVTAVLIFVGAALIFALEYSNPETIGNMSLLQKIQASVFQSATTRTAGFATLDQAALTDPTSLVCLVLMFIGGSPVGTAGGVKTVTVLVLVATAVSTIRNRDKVSLFGRSLSKQITRKAVAVVGMSFLITYASTVLTSLLTSAPLLDVLYETVSATATVGLTRGLTPLLDVAGKLVISLTMYFGRIGPISLAIAFGSGREITNNISNPIEEVSVG